MKKKQRIICISVVIGLIVACIVGVAVYVNLPPKESEWNVHISVENVSKSGLTLHMERNDVDGEAVELTTGDNFGVEKWTVFGWKPVWMKEGIGFNAVGYPMDETYEKTWEIDFEFFYDGLPMGLYRISKDAFISQNYKINEIYYAPFVVVTLWGTLLSVLVVALLIFVIWKFGTALNFQKIKEKISNRKEIKVVLIAVLLLVLGTYLLSKDWKWGIDFSVSHVSLAGVTVNVKRAKNETVRDVYYEPCVSVESWTWFQWKSIHGDAIIGCKCGSTHRIPPGYTGAEEIIWESLYGEIPSGCYRITHEARTSDKQDIKTYHTAFVIVRVQDILWAVFLIGIIIAATWIGKSWKEFSVRKRICCISLFIGVLVLLMGTAILIYRFHDKLNAVRWGYQVQLEETTDTGMRGEVRYRGDGIASVQHFLSLQGSYYLEKKTGNTWERISKINHKGEWQSGTIREGESATFAFDWEEECGRLSRGEYRIKHAFEIKKKGSDKRKNGNLYITFEVE